MLSNNTNNANGNNMDIMKMMFNDSSPRPKPRFPAVPTPMNLERPVPSVPDVSLIFSSPSRSMNLTNENPSCMSNISPLALASKPETRSSVSVSHAQSPNSIRSELGLTDQPIAIKLIQYLLDVTKTQGETINKMNEQIETLTEKQDKGFAELLSAINNRNILDLARSKTDVAIQTDTVEKSPGRNSFSSYVVPNLSQYEDFSSDDEDDTPILQSIEPAYRRLNCNGNRVLENREKMADMHQHQQISTRPPEIAHPFFPPSSPHVNNSPSKSATDTTLYGFPTKYLSFATKDYLQRHGLIKTDESPNYRQNNNNNVFNTNGNNPFFHNVGNGSNSSKNSSDEERILDVTALKNQPKLI